MNASSLSGECARRSSAVFGVAAGVDIGGPSWRSRETLCHRAGAGKTQIRVPSNPLRLLRSLERALKTCALLYVSRLTQATRGVQVWCWSSYPVFIRPWRRALNLLHRGANWGGERRGVMSHQEPARLAANENIRGLDGSFVETIGESGGDMLGAGHPAHSALDADPDGAEGDAHALGIGKNARPASAHLVPAEQQLPTGLNAFDCVVVRPDRFHLRDVERFERSIESLIRGANFFFGSLLLRRGLCGHGEVRGSMLEIRKLMLQTKFESAVLFRRPAIRRDSAAQFFCRASSKPRTAATINAIFMISPGRKGRRPA